ncbi:type 2 DNA topoisomerase 6 subunit B-like [Macrotis lagotis]|uniref:type 2 DNA topoisomerase 6 subunit B-like n=1 Tax=Macrotis lagotis TaxID=92651 RepID=UPI003D698B8A
MEARPVCEILKYLIIHWKREVAEISQEAFLEGKLLISIEESSSKQRADPFHYVTTIAFSGSVPGDLVAKKFLKEIQSLLSGFSGKLTWPSEKAHCSQDLSGLESFQMKFEAGEKPTTLMTDCLVIKQFVHRTSIVHPKIRFHFCVKLNGVLSKESFGVEKEPIMKLLNGIGLLTGQHHYMRPEFLGAQQVCRRIHPVLGHPVVLFIPDEEADVGFLGELTLTPVAALCPCRKLHPIQNSKISSAFVFLYGPSGVPLILPSQEHLLTVFDDNSYLFDWKKYHLCAAPNMNISLEKDLVLPDVSYWMESHEKSQPQASGEQAVLLFLMVDFHGGFPAQLTEAWGLRSSLLTRLNSILLKSRSLVQGAVRMAVEQALGQHHQLDKAQQKWQMSIPVAVSSILSIVVGSTSGSFRALCLQMLQAADTQEFGLQLLAAFQRSLPRCFLHHSPCDPQKRLPEPSGPEEGEGGEERPRPELGCPGRGPRPKRRRGEAPSCAQEDALWLQEVSNLSEWLGGPAGPAPRAPPRPPQ